MLPSNESTNIKDLEFITNMVNRVYAASEKGLWKQGAVRTTVEEIAEFTSHREMAVARLAGRIVGCVRIQRIDEETGEFGMLAVDEEYQGMGIGRELIRFAEQTCRKEHVRKMQLELLVPSEGAHQAKVILENWYKRLGYQPIYTESVEALFPKLAHLLAIPCKFIVFQKNLK